jgi:hypothetical protein
MTLYTPPKFLTVEVLASVVAEFEWPADYSLKDYNPDGIGMVFPRCTLVFREEFESEMELVFVPEETGIERTVTMYQVLLSRGGHDTPGLIDYFSPGASLEKVQNEIRDLCTTVLYNFHSTLLGDFSWVPAYREYLEQSRERPPEAM